MAYHGRGYRWHLCHRTAKGFAHGIIVSHNKYTMGVANSIATLFFTALLTGCSGSVVSDGSVDDDAVFDVTPSMRTPDRNRM